MNPKISYIAVEVVNIEDTEHELQIAEASTLALLKRRVAATHPNVTTLRYYKKIVKYSRIGV